MKIYYIQTMDKKGKHFVISDEGGQVYYHIHDKFSFSLFQKYSIQNKYEDMEIAQVSYRQAVMVPGFKVVNKDGGVFIKGRESLRTAYKLTGTELKIEYTRNLCYGFFDSSVLIAEMSLPRRDTEKKYEITVYDDTKMNDIVSIAVGIMVCIESSARSN